MVDIVAELTARATRKAHAEGNLREALRRVFGHGGDVWLDYCKKVREEIAHGNSAALIGVEHTIGKLYIDYELAVFGAHQPSLFNADGASYRRAATDPIVAEAFADFVTRAQEAAPGAGLKLSLYHSDMNGLTIGAHWASKD